MNYCPPAADAPSSMWTKSKKRRRNRKTSGPSCPDPPPFRAAARPWSPAAHYVRLKLMATLSMQWPRPMRKLRMTSSCPLRSSSRNPRVAERAIRSATPTKATTSSMSYRLRSPGGRRGARDVLARKAITKSFCTRPAAFWKPPLPLQNSHPRPLLNSCPPTQRPHHQRQSLTRHPHPLSSIPSLLSLSLTTLRYLIPTTIPTS